MLVPGMTLEEIRKEIELDIPSVYLKISGESYCGFRSMLKAHKTHTHRSYDYVSPRKNNWIIGYSYDAPTRKKETKHYMAIMYREKGFTVFSTPYNWMTIVLYTSHFFKRYNERLHLNLVDPKDKIRHFIQHTTDAPYEKLEDIGPGIYSFFAVNNLGTMLGVKYEKENIAKFNTFLSKEMLKGDQVALFEKLKERIGKYKNQLILD